MASDDREAPGAPELDISTKVDGEVSVVQVAGELDIATADRLEAALRERLAAGPTRLDLGGVSFMDSSGIRAIAAVLRDLPDAGWQLSVAPALQEPVRQILEMTGMLGALPLDRHPEDAR